MRIGNKATPYLLLAPILLVSGVMLYYCLGFTGVMSFFQWDGISNDRTWVGIQNYVDTLTDNTFTIALYNTLVFFAVTVFIQAAVGLLLAVLLKEKIPGNMFFKGIFFLPVIMAPVVLTTIFRLILDTNIGALNNLLRSIGLNKLAVSWLGDPKYALFSIICVNIYNWMGFSMMTYYAGLMSVDGQVYESAKLDGAGFLKTLFFITIPMLKGTTASLLLLGIIGSLKTFDIVFLLTGGGPGRSTEFLTTFLYRKAFDEYNSGQAASIGMIVLIIALVLSVIQNHSYEKSRFE
ncbi:MAG: sugar ABC transporter permease [Lachnospiraceae bacterium]|nr:sugar ABC transporter permease [Lachnospiraceae bacterium]MDE6929651.1 sugar ABC transporter permease [Lachnospiraceae bacterium]